MLLHEWVPGIILLSPPPTLSDLKDKNVLAEPSSGLTIENVTSQILLDEQRRIHESGLGETAYFARVAAKKGKVKYEEGPKH